MSTGERNKVESYPLRCIDGTRCIPGVGLNTKFQAVGGDGPAHAGDCPYVASFETVWLASQVADTRPGIAYDFSIGILRYLPFGAHG